MAVAPSTVFPGVGEEPPSGGMTEEVGQPMQGVQPILSSVPLVTQDPEASQPPVAQDLQPEQTFSPIKIVPLELVTELVLSKEPLGGASPSIQAGEPYSPLIKMLNLISLLFIYLFFQSSHFLFPFQVKPVFNLPLRLPLLWNQRILKVRVVHLYYASSSFPFFVLFPCLFLLWRSPQYPYLP